MLDEVVQILSDDGDDYGFDHKKKKSKERKKKGSKSDSHKSHEKHRGGPSESESLDSSDDDVNAYYSDHKSKKSKDNKKDNKTKGSKSDSHQTQKKRRNSSESSSFTDNSEGWSRVSGDSFPSSVSTGGRSSKKEKEYFADTHSHKSDSRDRHDHGSKPKGHRQHTRDSRHYRQQTPTSVSSRRPASVRYSDEDVTIEPGNSSRRLRDSQSSYVGKLHAHRRGMSYDDNVSVDHDSRSSTTSGRRGLIYPKRISNRAFSPDPYDYGHEREQEELEFQRRVGEELDRRDRKAKMERRVWDEVARKEEERRLRERIEEDMRRERVAREPTYGFSAPRRGTVYNDAPLRRAPPAYYPEEY